MKNIKPSQPLPPIPPNMGIRFYPAFVPIADIGDAIEKWNKGERPTEDHRKWWPALCARIDDLVHNVEISHDPAENSRATLAAEPSKTDSRGRCALATGSASGRRRFKKTWRELSFFERAAIVRENKERRETPEDRAITAALRDARIARETREAKMAKLRAFLLAKRTQYSSPNTPSEPRGI